MKITRETTNECILNVDSEDLILALHDLGHDFCGTSSAVEIMDAAIMARDMEVELWWEWCAERDHDTASDKHTWRTEFPDFGPIDVNLPEGFEDASSPDDAAPRFDNRALGLSIFIRHSDPVRRENSNASRFSIYVTNECSSFNSDMWPQILSFIDGWKRRGEMSGA